MFTLSPSFVIDQLYFIRNIWEHENSIAEEIKRRLRSGNACYDSVPNLLSSRLLSKNLKIKRYIEL